MSAEDVKYSFERIADPATKSPYKNDWATLDRVEVTGKLSGIIHLKEPFAPLWWSTLPWNAGLIVCKAAVDGLLGGDTAKVARYQARFAGVLFPGETIETSLWREGNQILISAKCKERNAPVISNAAIKLRS